MTVGARGPTKERLARARLAKRLRKQGMKYREIAEELGIGKSYVDSLLNDPDGARSRARKDSYQGRCEVCGDPTSGGNGPANAAKRCNRHSQERKWTDERVLEAGVQWMRMFGRPPSARQWRRSQTIDGVEFPSFSLCYTQSRQSGSSRRARALPWFRWSDYTAAVVAAYEAEEVAA